MTNNYKVINYLNITEEINLQSNKVTIRCKFITINNEDTKYFIFGSLTEFPYHAALVNRFCNDNMILSTWEKKPDYCLILDKDYHIEGGGWLEIDSKEQILRLFGNSTAYGKFTSTNLLDIFENNNQFPNFKVFID